MGPTFQTMNGIHPMSHPIANSPMSMIGNCALPSHHSIDINHTPLLTAPGPSMFGTNGLGETINPNVVGGGIFLGSGANDTPAGPSLHATLDVQQGCKYITTNIQLGKIYSPCLNKPQ